MARLGRAFPASAIQFGVLQTLNEVTGSLSVTIENITSSTDADLAIGGASSATLGNLTASADSDLEIVGALSQTVGNLSLSASGAIGSDDTTPDQFSFQDESGVAISTVITSQPVTITGINATVTFTATGGTIDVNEDGNFQTSRDVSNGDTLRARHTSSGSYLTTTDTTVSGGGVSDIFTSTTRTEPAAGGGSINAPVRLGGMMIFG